MAGPKAVVAGVVERVPCKSQEAHPTPKACHGWTKSRSWRPNVMFRVPWRFVRVQARNVRLAPAPQRAGDGVAEAQSSLKSDPRRCGPGSGEAASTAADEDDRCVGLRGDGDNRAAMAPEPGGFAPHEKEESWLAIPFVKGQMKLSISFWRSALFANMLAWNCSARSSFVLLLSGLSPLASGLFVR